MVNVCYCASTAKIRQASLACQLKNTFDTLKTDSEPIWLKCQHDFQSGVNRKTFSE